MVNSPYQIYQQSSVQTANGGKLIIMLYEGAIRFTKLGIDAVHNRKYDAANTNFLKAQAIINELIASLNFNYPISNDLVKIYEYMLHCLIQANVKKNATIAEEVVAHLMDLLGTWKQVSNGTAGNHQAAVDSI
ncbi:flagellar export chaperone FliS [Paenibacillus spongiae]|uniref:Flagellar secretion chaperone FliS n=1 Tax=Paenibacillus spongiae TaxID=2909671 RepID=A0ABY5S7L1_9BACL|nr:flagellar export chaperone FliS [Paenibacillus spongiae]UVI29889.1 flagellar export chaperone FliS [Paenibacillus spongiae]